MITKHFCDSLCLVKGFSDIEKTVSLIDVGTGAGFPGIPLKIAFPHLKVTLLDSLNKRVRFLEEVCERLDLENVTCVHARAEDGGRNKDLREKFDLCVSRAVALGVEKGEPDIMKKRHIIPILIRRIITNNQIY